MMNIKISQELPKQDFFLLAQPKATYPENRSNQSIVTITDPYSKNVIKAQFYDMWTVDEHDFDHMSGFALLAYGIEPFKLKEKLIEDYPQLKKNFIVEYWLLKKIQS